MFDSNGGMRELESVADEQLLLPFDFEEPKIDVASIPHFDAPQDDNERLLEYQYRYKVEGEKSALGDMYRLGVEVCKKMISQKAKTNKHVKKLNADTREEKAIDATNYIIMRLIQRPRWFIKTSFTAYLYLRLLHELFYRRKVDEIVRFVSLEEMQGVMYHE
nr:MAG TPA: hypothetical protein [Caudoviricetes sp.]